MAEVRHFPTSSRATTGQARPIHNRVACCQMGVRPGRLVSRTASWPVLSTRVAAPCECGRYESDRFGNFAVLMFVPPGSTDGEAVNLQLARFRVAVGLYFDPAG